MTSETRAVGERTLVVRFGRLGDMLVVTPALRAIRRAAPDARVDVLTSHDGRTVLARNPHVHALHVLRARRVPRAINIERLRLEARLRAIGFDSVFLLEGAHRYRDLVRRLRAPRVYTFALAGETADAFHAPRGDGHELHNFFAVLALAGIAPDGEQYDFSLPDPARARARTLLEAAGLRGPSIGPSPAPTGTLVGVHAGFHRRRLRRRTHPKAWPLERWSRVIVQLAERTGSRFVLTGSQRERALNDRIIAGLPSGLAHNMAGETDIETLAAIIDQCDVFIAPDTGPAHLAAAVGTPVVALFGPKPPHIMGPRGDERIIARLYAEPSAADERERQGHHPRMWALQAEDVVDAAVALLECAAPRPV